MVDKADEYREPISQETAEIRVKGSRFIARIVPIVSHDEAAAGIASVRREHYDATHHCSAYRLGPGGIESRFNDDGEPSGTAGMPILRQLEGSGLTNALVVVTRYYGGTKLGTGGLARAYGGAAAEVLQKARVATRVQREAVRVTFEYADTSPAMHTIGLFDVKVVESVYGDRTELHLAVRRSQAEAFSDAFVDALGGRGEVAAG